ncbi:FlgO family outer membrane protein [Campylobacterota bacterium DY0563]|uniref:FlgO family outer membrane protein n=1 Tax=Halarcobacter sp. TaxID=2321133 RepID=UPI0029F54F1D|nr:FlgO family outer membrane protein [Halarcobacter sp.]
MNNFFVKVLKYNLLPILLITFFTGCVDMVKEVTTGNIAKKIASKSPTYHKNLTGANDFNSLVENLIQDQESKVAKYITSEEIILVPDFVNINRLQNRSKLGFLLSEQMKNSLSNRGIIIKAIELGRDFQYGKHGFNLLTRNQKDIKDKTVDNNYAFVGTYSITTQSLIVFIKLIDIKNGTILSSAYSETLIDEEILDLERSSSHSHIITPMVL